MTSPIVETSSGRVRGAVVNGVEIFRGVPYAASTAGAGRFAPPQPADPWTKTRDALENGDRCPQGPEAMAKGPMSEDCLALNVWTPSSRDGARRPVMVWLHPGGFSGGAGYQYTGKGNLAKRGDIVQVEVNHRLGVFGYLYLGGVPGLAERFPDAGNVGMLDLVAALEWVRDNIAAFGGDPGNVTIFGESGGGAKVSTLMAMPRAQGLFHKAIAQSGFALRAVEPEAAEESTARLHEKLGLRADAADALLGTSSDDLLAAFQSVRGELGGPRDFGPVKDGRTLLRHPWHPDAPDASTDVPMMLGCTRDETTILLGMLGSDPNAAFDLSDAQLRARLADRFGTDADATQAIVDCYRAAMPGASPSDVFFRATSDHMMRVPSILQAERKAAQSAAPVWLYCFSWADSPFMGGRMKAHHGGELPFVFDTVEASAAMIGDGEDRVVLAEAMRGAWSHLAHTGDPSHEKLPTWNPYAANARETMLFDMPCRVESDPGGSERRAIEPLLVG